MTDKINRSNNKMTVRENWFKGSELPMQVNLSFRVKAYVFMRVIRASALDR